MATRKRDIPLDLADVQITLRPHPRPHADEEFTTLPLVYPPRPSTAIEALMQAAPNQEPEESVDEAIERNAELGDIIWRHAAALTGLEGTATNLHLRGYSSRQVAKELAVSKSLAWKLIRSGLDKLAESLADEPVVKGRLAPSDSAGTHETSRGTL